MKKILMFAGSNYSKSINKEVIQITADLMNGVETEIIELNDYEPPMFGKDIEENGLPNEIQQLLELVDAADAVVISTPEYNGLPPAFLKNITEWLSRIHLHLDREEKWLENKPVFLMSSSTGRGGAMKARAHLKNLIERANGNVVAEFSLPSFNHTTENGKITDDELLKELKHQIEFFIRTITRK